VVNANAGATGATTRTLPGTLRFNSFGGGRFTTASRQIPTVNANSLPQNVQNSFNQYNQAGWNGSLPTHTLGTRAGGTFRNNNGALPRFDASGRPITYREFDVNNSIPGVNRDAQRFVVGSDGSIFFTNDHYGTFFRVMP